MSIFQVKFEMDLMAIKREPIEEEININDVNGNGNRKRVQMKRGDMMAISHYKEQLTSRSFGLQKVPSMSDLSEDSSLGKLFI